MSRPARPGREHDSLATTVASGPRGEAGEHVVAIDGRIGRYVVDRPLGSGGMGVVYLARDPELDRQVAIKLLRPELRESRERLLREGQAVARLVHPNVVTVFDVGDHGADLFIAMEYVPGETLGAWLDRPRSWRAILACFVEAGRGLAAAHKAGVIHRDFKPDNVLRSDDGRVVVSDFGLAFADDVALRTADEERRSDLAATRTAGMVGTPAYMSPEQFRGHEVDARADQFSFCVALWEALFGARPFETRVPKSPTAIEELAQAVLTGAIQPPVRDPGVPRRVMRALRRGLAVERDARFPRMEALLAELTPPDRRVVFGGVAVGALALGTVGWVATRDGGSSGVASVRDACTTRAASRLAEVWSPAARGAYGAPAEEAGWFETIAARWIDASREVCAHPDRPERASCLDDVLVQLKAAATRSDRTFLPAVIDPRACLEAAPPVARELRTQLGNIDPSGAIGASGAIAFAGDDGMAAMFDGTGAPERPELLAGVDRVYAWSEDGATLVARSGGQLVRIDTRTGEHTRLAEQAAGIAAASADGRIVARAEGGELRVTVDGVEKLRAPSRLTPDDRQDIELSPDGRRVALSRDTEDGAELFVGDLTTGRGAWTTLRVHGDAGNVIAMAWADARRIVFGGSNARGDQEGLWLVELDDAGAVSGPPASLVAPRPNTVMDVVTIRGRSALVVQVDVIIRLQRLRGGTSAPLPGLLDVPLWGADARRELLMLGERGGARVVTLQGASVARVVADGEPVLREGKLWFAHGTGGHVELRGDGTPPFVLPGKTTIGAELDRMHCASGGGCVVSWIDDRDVLRHALVGPDGLGKPFEVKLRERGLDPSPDAKRALVHTDTDLAEHDVASGRLRVLHRVEPGCAIDHAVYTPDGRAAVFVSTCAGRRTIWHRSLDDGATPRVLERLAQDVDVTHVEALGDTDVVYRTVEYQSRLVKLDGLPVPPLASTGTR
ncbi:MAG TPA: protein kinase [Kofleriaceae bacterium]|nr:protein kinase [Kofleriaceae bacterium]